MPHPLLFTPLELRGLGADPKFGLWPQQYGWWLTRRQPLIERVKAAKAQR